MSVACVLAILAFALQIICMATGRISRDVPVLLLCIAVFIGCLWR